MKITDVMTKSPFTCSSDDSLAAAAELMWDHDCGSIVVVDVSQRPVAMITDRDICMAAFTRGLPLHAMTVSSAASKLVHTARADDSIETGEATMKAWQLRRLPVVDASGSLVGVLSLNDLVRNATQSSVRKDDGLTPAGITQTLAAICEKKLVAVQGPLHMFAP